jgi:hypothetical protein
MSTHDVPRMCRSGTTDAAVHESLFWPHETDMAGRPDDVCYWGTNGHRSFAV